MASNGSAMSVYRAPWGPTEDVGLLRAVLDVLEVGVALLDHRAQYLYRNRLTDAVMTLKTSLTKTEKASCADKLGTGRLIKVTLDAPVNAGDPVFSTTSVPCDMKFHSVQNITHQRLRERRLGAHRLHGLPRGRLREDPLFHGVRRRSGTGDAHQDEGRGQRPERVDGRDGHGSKKNRKRFPSRAADHPLFWVQCADISRICREAVGPPSAGV
jgi:hypothetical protein